MKKLVFLLAVAFSAALYSCGNKAEEATTDVDTTAVEAVEEPAPEVAPADSAADTTVVVEEAVEVAE